MDLPHKNEIFFMRQIRVEESEQFKRIIRDGST